MKNFRKLLIPVLLVALTGCQGNTQNSSNVSSGTTSSSSTTTSTSSSTTEIVEVTKKFSLTLNPTEGTTILVSQPSEDGKYEAGSTISFTVTVEDANKELEYVKVNEKVVLPSNNNVYEIVMPNVDTTISTTVKVLGPENLLDVANVDTESLPKTAQDVVTLLTNNDAVDSKYLVTSSLESTFETSNTYVKLDSVVGINDVVLTKGYELSYASASMYTYVETELGLQNGYFYELNTETSKGETSKTISTLKVVDKEDGLLTSEITEGEANLTVTSSTTNAYLLNRLFSPTSDQSFLNERSYGWENITVETDVATDLKSYTVTVSGVYKSYKRTVELVLELDGNNFITKALFNQNDYESEDFDTETNLPFDDATPKAVKYIEINKTKGYRQTLANKTNISQYALESYDVVLSYQLDKQSEKEVVENTVEDSAVLKYKVRQNDSKNAMIYPVVVGSKEEGKITFNDKGEPVFNGVGTTTILFDNGLGLLKEVSVNVVQPVPYSITATLPGNKIFNGETNILTVNISPVAANQEVSVTLKEDSTCTVNITKNEDGTYSIEALTNGNGTLVITSVVDPQITTEIDFVVEDKPDVEAIKTFLTATTLQGEVSGWGSHFINLNSDGTGEYVCYENSKGDVIPFTWTLNESSLTIEVEVDESLKSGYYNFGGFENLTETSVDFYFYYSGSRKGPAVLTALDSKLDFATADLSKY